MRVSAINLKPSAKLVDVLVMALAAYFALHASTLRSNHQPKQTLPAGFTQLAEPVFSVS